MSGDSVADNQCPRAEGHKERGLVTDGRLSGDGDPAKAPIAERLGRPVSRSPASR